MRRRRLAGLGERLGQLAHPRLERVDLALHLAWVRVQARVRVRVRIIRVDLGQGLGLGLGFGPGLGLGLDLGQGLGFGLGFGLRLGFGLHLRPQLGSRRLGLGGRLGHQRLGGASPAATHLRLARERRTAQTARRTAQTGRLNAHVPAAMQPGACGTIEAALDVCPR